MEMMKAEFNLRAIREIKLKRINNCLRGRERDGKVYKSVDRMKVSANLSYVKGHQQ